MIPCTPFEIFRERLSFLPEIVLMHAETVDMQ